MYGCNVYNDEEIEGRGFHVIVTVRSSIKNRLENDLYSFEGKGLLNKQILRFVENKIHNELRMELDKVVFIRKKENEGTFYFTFQEKKNTFLEYSGAVGTLKIPLYTERMLKKENKIEIDYILNETEKFLLQIAYE